jgi:hypothetical protein
MTMKLNRGAYEKLIEEDIEAMEKSKFAFEANGVLLEWRHIIEVLKASPDREYGEKEGS